MDDKEQEPFKHPPERTSTGGFVQCPDKRSVAWQAARRLTRTNSALYADAQDEQQTRSILSRSVWHVLDVERSGKVSPDSIQLVSNLTAIATKPKKPASGCSIPKEARKGRAGAFAPVLQQAKGDDGFITFDDYLRTLQSEPVAVECAPFHVNMHPTHADSSTSKCMSS